MSAPHPSLEPALAALERGDWSSAKAATLAYLGAQPRSSEGFLLLASALHRTGEMDKSLLALGQALMLDANQSAGYFLLGMVLEALDQPGYAERAYATALRLDPEHPTAMQRRLACRSRASAPPLPEADAQAIERLLDALRPTVSACLIVKNEEKTLARCLESLKGWVDEIVVVDTGSTDATVAIVESFGARVGHFAWVDDFSAARNASLELATSEWVLVIDADETLEVADAEAWTAWLRRRTFGGYAIYQANLRDDGAIDNETPVMRLFQRLPGVRFANRLHESVGPALEALGLVVVDGRFAKLRHTGYQSDALAERQKGQRNLALARKTAEERPDDVIALYQLGRGHLLANQPAEALPVFERMAGLPGVADLPRTLWANFVTVYGSLLVGVSRHAEAIALYDRALAQLPDFPEFLFERGLALAAVGRLDDARADFARCLAMAGHPFALTMRHGITDALPREALAQLDAAHPPAPPTVSVCMIVKNEEATLARCLESLKGWVDEIVVVDTGSTDGTVAIAESFGARVGHFTWVDDFSAARNASLELATSEWALVIDADETFEVVDPEAWRQALRRRDVGGYVVTVRNLGDDGTAETDAPVLRLFKRDARVRFTGRLHESTGPAIEALGRPIGELLAVRLHHTGYQSATMAARQKGTRNLAIARKAADEQPNDLDAQLQLARALCFDHRRAEALPVLERLAAMPALHALPLSPWANYVGIHADVLRQIGRLADAEVLLTDALVRLPDFPEFLFDRGIVRARLGRPDEARADFERCLALAGRSFGLTMRDGVTGALPRQALAELAAVAADHAARPTVSACLIVKNEAQNLAHCLESLKGFVDEIVVVDTGSTDATVAIAESFGARVGHFTWVDDFSAARNASLELATSEWVLVIDADEALEAHPAHWRQVLTGPCEAVTLTQANLDDAGNLASETQALRLFKRDARVRFAGRLHESVAMDVSRLGWRLGGAPFLTLRHTGYQRARVEAADKGRRNVRIAEAAAGERPGAPDAWLDLARSHALDRNPAAALAAFERLDALPGGMEALDERAWIYAVQARQAAYRDLGRDRDAEAQLDRALARLPGFPEFHAERAALRLLRGDRGGAVADYRACLAAHGRPFAVPVRPGLTDTLPARALDALPPTVSACLIVKNEAQNLARCLESLKGFVDEIVVVDTGSTDGTVAIAESFGARVGHFAWVDDFSAARNASLELATSEWALIVDADETLAVEDPDTWRQALRRREFGGMMLTLTNVRDDGTAENDAPVLRLVWRTPAIRFAGRLHESPIASIQALGLPLAELPGVRIRHTGYQPAAMAERDKGRRNLAIAQKDAEDRPDDVEALLQLARSQCFAGEPLAALPVLERLAAMPRSAEMPLAPWAGYVTMHADVLRHVGRLADAEALLTGALERLPGCPEFLFDRGAIRHQLGRAHEARLDFEGCLAAAGRPFGISMRHGVTDELPRRALAELAATTLAARPTVSACLIVKNEEKMLARCLESLKGWVDEIVVVDTGSTDGTVAIAESFGAKVGHFTWVHDFAAARNASLALATSEWVLVIDADEQLRVEDADAWRRALEVSDRAYLLEIVNVDDRGLVASRTISYPRMFRRHPVVRFEGRLHETPGDALNALGWQMTPVGCAWLRHEGYTASVIASNDKLARNRGLAEQMIRDNPLDPDAWHFLANANWLGKDAAATLAALAGLAKVEAAGHPLSLNLKRTAILVETWALTAEGRFAEALAVIEAGLRLAPGYVEYMHERGRLRARLGDDEGAIADLTACLAVPRGSVTAREGLSGYASHTELAELYVRRGRLDRAADHMRAAADDPACPAAEAAELRTVAGHMTTGAPVTPTAPPVPVDRLEAATAALVAGDWPAAKAHAIAHLESHPRSADGFLAIALAFYRLGELDRALLALGQALPLDANAATGYFLFGLVLEALGQPAYAERAFATALRLDPEHPTAMQRRLACRGRQAEHPLAAPDAQAIERLLAAVRPTVSACLIVKNEEKTLARCLESLKGFVDEIVVVDTGSTDGTVAIAESFGARVGHFAWVDDFSAARNASLELATSEWVLVIDADEILAIEAPETWTRALRRRALGGYVLVQRNAQVDDAPLDNPLMRLFQRHDGIRYNGRLHEDVTRAIAALGWPIADLPGARLDHDGYLPEQAAAKDKWSRNFQLALAEVEAAPDDAAAWYNLGRSAMNLGQAEGSLAAFSQVGRLLAAGAELSEPRYCTFVAMHQRLLAEHGRADEALALLTAGLARVDGFPEFHYERGLRLAELGRHAEARRDFEAAMRPARRGYVAAMRQGITDALPRAALAALDRPPLHT